jgi:hypothetical protein
MSVRWQSPLLLSLFCAVVAGGPLIPSAHAQCNHGGGMMPRLSGMFSPQQMLQQQMLQQQQMLLLQQQMQQQQQLQLTAKRDKDMRDLSDKGPDALRAALSDPKPEMRLLAAQAVGKYGPDLTNELIDLLTDDVAAVRQAARRSLVKINNSAGRRSVDFGPAEGANKIAQKASAKKWRTWFDRATARADRKTSAVPADAKEK